MGEIVELIIVASNLDNVVSCLLNYPENNRTKSNRQKSKAKPKKCHKYIILHESEKENKLHLPYLNGNSLFGSR